MYRVHWTDKARAELRAIWQTASPNDDQLLIWAVSDISYCLERDPENEGESRPRNTRVMYSRPLGVLFSVPTGGLVLVHAIWRHR